MDELSGGQTGWRVATILLLPSAPDGAIWVGTENGASRFDGASWTNLTTADGLAADRVDAIAVAPDGAVWLAIVMVAQLDMTVPVGRHTPSAVSWRIRA